MPYLFMLCGPSGIGKSYLREKEDLKPYVSRDEIRFSILREKDAYFSKEELVRNTYVHTLAWYLANGVSVFADSTNLNPVKRQKLMLDICHEYETLRPEDKRKAIKFVTIDCVPQNIKTLSELFDMCKEHNAKRTGRSLVPEDDLLAMCKVYIRPNEYDEIWIHKNIHMEDIKDVWKPM
jgi:predicted kinase